MEVFFDWLRFVRWQKRTLRSLQDELAALKIHQEDVIMGLKEELLAAVAALHTSVAGAADRVVAEVQKEEAEDVAQMAELAAALARIAELEALIALLEARPDEATVQEVIAQLQAEKALAEAILAAAPEPEPPVEG